MHHTNDECLCQMLKQSIKVEVAKRDRRGLEGEGVETCWDDDPLGPAKAV